MQFKSPISGPRLAAWAALVVALVSPWSAAGQTPPAPVQGRASQPSLRMTVTDENGVPVPAARVALTHAETQAITRGETDYAGRAAFPGLAPGTYRVQVEKQGFYAVTVNEARRGAAALEITLHHLQEFSEVMDVVYSPPAIDATKTDASEGLSGQDLVNLPYPTTRDLRNALPFIPGVVQDNAGQLHVNGASSNQTFVQLDGFNITHPASGLFEMRVSVDALRSIEVLGSRYSAEYGKGSGGVLNLLTGMGDDRLRFSATNFIPSFQNRKGLNFDNWTPRATLSGPLRRKRAWFFVAADGEANLDIIEELPEGADRNRSWRIGSLTKAQVNLNPANILTAGLLFNRFHADRAGISRFTPAATTRELSRSAYLATLKHQTTFANRALLEVGLAVNQFRAAERPRGREPFVISPAGSSGNFFREADSVARRYQGVINFFLPPFNRRGRHEFKVGGDFDRLTYDQSFDRRPITVLRADGTRARLVTYTNLPGFRTRNTEVSVYAQDRWAVTGRTLVELGARLDRDRIVGRVTAAPRFAFSHLLAADGETKLSGGVGLYYDATNLDFVTRPLAGRRVDLFFGADGLTPTRPPVETAFVVREGDLRAPRFINWSLGLERRLPAAVYLRAELLGKQGRDGFTFVQGDSTPRISRFELRNARRDRYDALQVTLRRAFKGGYEAMASYTRSRARSNAVFEFDLDSPIFGDQAGGPLPWDAPNRLISWGWFPLRRHWDIGYSLEWRDGYPFSVVNQNQQLVGPPNSRRFPAYFSLNTHLERRFTFKGYRFGLRAGMNNLTDRENPTAINNNVDAPEFLTVGGVQGRAFIGRIRFLGRK